MKAAEITARRSDHLIAAVESSLEEANIKECASAYLCDLGALEFGEWRSGQNVYPASVIKVPLMVEAFHQFRDRVLAPDQRVVITESNMTATDEPSPFIPGYQTTIAELVELMITHSDNVATNQLMDILRREKVTAYMHELGLQTFLLGRKLSGSEPLIDDPEMIGRNRLPAGEIGQLLTLIALDVVPGASEQRAILSRCIHRTKLAAALRPGDRFMNKTGLTSSVSHDAGILYTAEGKRWVVVLYLEVEPNPDGSDAVHADPLLTNFMRALRPNL